MSSVSDQCFSSQFSLISLFLLYEKLKNLLVTVAAHASLSLTWSATAQHPFSLDM